MCVCVCVCETVHGDHGSNKYGTEPCEMPANRICSTWYTPKLVSEFLRQCRVADGMGDTTPAAHVPPHPIVSRSSHGGGRGWLGGANVLEMTPTTTQLPSHWGLLVRCCGTCDYHMYRRWVATQHTESGGGGGGNDKKCEHSHSTIDIL